MTDWRRSYDAVVIGAGIAGSSAAWALSSYIDVALLETEPQAGHHATGRSASVLSETSGHPIVCQLARASRPFLEEPPVGFADHPLLTPRGLLWIGREETSDELDRLAERSHEWNADVHRWPNTRATALVPCLRPEAVGGGAVHEPDAASIDVDALLYGFLRGLRARGGDVLLACGAMDIDRGPSGWQVRTPRGTIAAPLLVDAAGAWGDAVAERAGVAPLGLRPLRRTAAIVPTDADTRRWPLVMDVSGDGYFEPDSGGLLVSPADETDSAPTDARPEELDVARGVEFVRTVTTLDVRSVRRAWAGLRTFASDRLPVVGLDPDNDGFFWLVGQGGAGIKTSPALAQLASALVRGAAPPTDLAPLVTALSPSRLRHQGTAV